MKPIRNNEHIQERIAMAAAFASVLIKPSSASPFMLDIWGGAGIGKTTILIAAASIWGDPQMPGGYIGTFNASDVANEQLAMFCCDLPLLLDEMQTIQNQRNFKRSFISSVKESRKAARHRRVPCGNRTHGITRFLLSTGFVFGE